MVTITSRMARPHGNVTLTFRDAITGEITREIHCNLITTAARELVNDHMTGVSTEVPDEIAVGDQVSPSTPTISDTVLDSELDRSTITSKTQPTTTQAQYVTLFGTGEANGTLTEAGLFTPLSASNILFARVTFGGVVKTSGFTLTVTWDVFF